MEHNLPTRAQGVSAALAAAQARSAIASSARFPGEDSGRSLADMAQRDLDAALQLLADRAQYITGASGAAIALRRDGRDDLMCRASVGENAPELGALLSTEFGLSGESVRTRRLMRCDDAERDTRVNREVCREMGISSVLVMPVVNDDQVLGVFELFSGKVNAFGERDLSAVQRLSEMVETAVRMAHAAETLPEHLSSRESTVAEAMHPEVFEGQFLSDLVVEESQQPRAEVQAAEAVAALEPSVVECVAPPTDSTPAVISTEQSIQAPEPVQSASLSAATTTARVAKKPLFWSAAAGAEGDSNVSSAVTDESNVPPMLRGLRKCEACGFPISGGRMLCVECEEKKWRGQLKPQSARKPVSSVAPVPGVVTSATPSVGKKPPVLTQPAQVAQQQNSVISKAEGSSTASLGAEVAIPKGESGQTREPEFVLSAGMGSSPSWFSTNKWIVVALLVIGGAAAAFLLLR